MKIEEKVLAFLRNEQVGEEGKIKIVPMNSRGKVSTPMADQVVYANTVPEAIDKIKSGELPGYEYEVYNNDFYVATLMVIGRALKVSFTNKPSRELTIADIKNMDKGSRLREDVSEDEEFEPHMMYDPKTGKGYKAEKPEDHERMSKLGYVHKKPESIEESEISSNDYRFDKLPRVQKIKILKREIERGLIDNQLDPADVERLEKRIKDLGGKVDRAPKKKSGFHPPKVSGRDVGITPAYIKRDLGYPDWVADDKSQMTSVEIKKVDSRSVTFRDSMFELTGVVSHDEWKKLAKIR